MIFVSYYLILNWPTLKIKVKNYIPFNNKEKIIRDIADITKKK